MADAESAGPKLRAAALTISSSRTEADDRGGPALADYIFDLGLELQVREIIPDDRELIADRLRRLCDEVGVSLILTTGGTGFSPDDVTPEATRDVIEREAPGFGEAMRDASKPYTDKWMVSRAIAGTRGRTLIVNFPGSPKSIGETGESIAAAIPHALRLLQGSDDAH